MESKLVIPPYVTASGKIVISDKYEISPTEHTVSDATRGLKTYPLLGVKYLIFYLIIGFVVSSITYPIWIFLLKLETDENLFPLLRNIIGILNIFTPFVVFGSVALGLIMGVKCFFYYCIRPNLKTPEDTVRGFFESFEFPYFPERAYNLLTDQARTLGKIDDNISSDIIAQRLPRVNIYDLPSFKQWWRDLTFSWDINWGKLIKYELGSNLCLLEIVIEVNIPTPELQKTSFTSAFPLIKHNNLWFLATPIMWPCINNDLPKDQREAIQ